MTRSRIHLNSVRAEQCYTIAKDHEYFDYSMIHEGLSKEAKRGTSPHDVFSLILDWIEVGVAKHDRRPYMFRLNQ